MEQLTIEQIRNRLKYATPEKIGEDMDVSPATLRRIQKGSDVSPRILRKISKFFLALEA